MRDLYKRFLDRELSRRQFSRGLTALGLSGAAANSVLASLAAAREPLPAEGYKFEGTGAEVLLETLRSAGIRYLFGTTATGMSPLFDAMTLKPDTQFILSISESQATSMAHGYELVSGEVGALFVPGVAIPSTMNNLYNAWKDRSALAVFSDAQSNRLPGRNMFQQMEDWLEPMNQFTKWRWQVNNESHIAEMTRRAIKLAVTAPGGPVHVRYPLNILGATGVKQTILPHSRFHVPVEMRPKPELIEQTAKLLLEAEKPMLCCGSEVTRAGANAELVALAELIGAPVAQGFSVYGDFPFRHPLFAGFYGLGVPRGLAGVDVFANFGAQMPDPGMFTAPVPRSARTIQARIDPDDIANIYPADVAIAAGMKETLVDLTDAIRGMASGERLRKMGEAGLSAGRQRLAERDAQRKEQATEYWDASPLSWERISAELEDALEDDAIIIPELDYRTPLHWMNFDTGKKWLVGQTTGFALGWGIGAAIGAKIARPDRQVVCLVGDGALLFGQVEALWTAARYDVPTVIVVFNNRSYDNERNRIQNRSPLYRSKATRDQWRDITGYLGDPDVDFVALAKAFEIDGALVETPEQLRKALRTAKSVTQDGRPFLIDVITMQIDQRGRRTEQTWYPEISIAAGRRNKV